MTEHESDWEEWTYKWHHHSNQVQNSLQSLLTDDVFVWNSPAEGEVAQAKEFNVRIISLVTLASEQRSSAKSRSGCNE